MLDHARFRDMRLELASTVLVYGETDIQRQPLRHLLRNLVNRWYGVGLDSP